MELADSQGGHVAADAHAPATSASGGAEGEKTADGGKKVDQIVNKLASQVVSRLAAQNKDQSADIRTLAEAVQSLQSEINVLKRRNLSDSDSPPAKKRNSPAVEILETTPRPSSPRPGTSAQSDTDSRDSDDELEQFFKPEETSSANSYAELEDYFQVEDETGEEVGEHIARITEKALRGGSSKKDEEKLQDLKQKHKRPMNINNLQVPKVEEMLWRQLSRSTKHSDFMQQVAVANYGQAMVPIIKALELMQSKKDPERMQTYMMDAFKTLSLLIKTTNTARLEKVKKELNPRYREVCQEGPSATKLLGDNFHETVKKLDQAKGNLTVQMAQPFLGRRGGDKPNMSSLRPNMSFPRYRQNQHSQRPFNRSAPPRYHINHQNKGPTTFKRKNPPPRRK